MSALRWVPLEFLNDVESYHGQASDGCGNTKTGWQGKYLTLSFGDPVDGPTIFAFGALTLHLLLRGVWRDRSAAPVGKKSVHRSAAALARDIGNERLVSMGNIRPALESVLASSISS